MHLWATEHLGKLSSESFDRFVAIQKNPSKLDDPHALRVALLDFIADFANPDNAAISEYISTARELTGAAHIALGGTYGSQPLIVDPFAGGGSIPLEALRVGGDVFASDLNPIPVLLNKIALEYVPKYGPLLVGEIRKWGDWISNEAAKELAAFYPKEADGAAPIAYLWARTIRCEGPNCGVQIPLIRSLWLAKTGASNSIALELTPNKERTAILVSLKDGAQSASVGEGTVKRSSATCPCCGYTTPASKVRAQFANRRGGAEDARLLAVRFDDPKTGKRGFRLPKARDIDAARDAAATLEERIQRSNSPLSLVPNEELPYLRSIFNIKLLGVDTWGMLFSPRQALSLVVFAEKVRQLDDVLPKQMPREERLAIKTCLAIVLDRLADFNSSLCVLNSVGGRGVVHTFGRQALGIVWDFMETNPFNDVGANWNAGLEAFEMYLAANPLKAVATTAKCSAADHPLPDDAAALFVTDPPYYDAVPYADLSDFFFVWLKRTIGADYPELLSSTLTDKHGEIVQLAERNPNYRYKTRQYFEDLMRQAMSEGRRILQPTGIGIVVFAHKTTTGWETQLQAMIDAGWIITASWPIDTERPGRLRALDSAVLASSIHLVCRPRDRSLDTKTDADVGDWRDVLQELPRRIHDWMPRLAEEGVVGADAIFACLGPALEIFSRYSRVEKASGEVVALREYLEQVWAAVSREALSLVFKDADATGFEPDARLTAMWLWTLNAGTLIESSNESDEQTDAAEEEDTEKKPKAAGFVLEYDAARKIAQGLGANLDGMRTLIEVRGDIARLLPVSERAATLFGQEKLAAQKSKKKVAQVDLFTTLVLDDRSPDFVEPKLSKPGETTLDRIHQAMILFAAGRGDAMKRFLVDDRAGHDPKFWRLAQALSALYPNQTVEKRWVDGVLARKKGLGF